MKNFSFTKRDPKARRGSALLISVLVMGVLLVLTLGLSDLVIREISQTTNMVASGEAYFAAEAGVEKALLDLHENLPGYEIKNYKDVKAEKNDDSYYRYRILNTADKVPYFDPGKALFLRPNEPAISSDALYDVLPEATYNVLGLNQTVVIPLSSAQGGDVKDFLVQYYFKADPDNEILNNPQNFNNIDILRWKIFGYPKVGASGYDSSKTDAISDLYPALHGNTSTSPVCIGTFGGLEIGVPNTNCLLPSPTLNPGDIPSQDTPVEQTNWGAARQCLSSDAGTLPGSELAEVQKNCTIQNFIDTHTQNYLVLSNYVNPDLVGLTNLDLDVGKANIYYRVIAKSGENEPKLVRESAAISADGFALDGKVKQSIDVNISLNSFLPVFHFTLYRTDTSAKLDAQNIPAPKP
jgi:hypothetical protein